MIDSDQPRDRASGRDHCRGAFVKDRKRTDASWPALSARETAVDIEELIKRNQFPRDVRSGELVSIGSLEGTFMHTKGGQSSPFETTEHVMVIKSKETGLHHEYSVSELVKRGNAALPLHGTADQEREQLRRASEPR